MDEVDEASSPRNNVEEVDEALLRNALDKVSSPRNNVEEVDNEVFSARNELDEAFSPRNALDEVFLRNVLDEMPLLRNDPSAPKSSVKSSPRGLCASELLNGSP